LEIYTREPVIGTLDSRTVFRLLMKRLDSAQLQCDWNKEKLFSAKCRGGRTTESFEVYWGEQGLQRPCWHCHTRAEALCAFL